MGVHKLTCHCGAVELEVRLSDGLNTARRCDCSYCHRRGAIAASAPVAGGVKVVRGADKLTLYQWGTKTAKHWSAWSVASIRITSAGRTLTNTG